MAFRRYSLLLVACLMLLSLVTYADEPEEEQSLKDRFPPISNARPTGGCFDKQVKVTITSKDDKDKQPCIHYTIDGTEPDASSPVYRRPIVFKRDTVLKYQAVDSSGKWEEVKTDTYLVGDASFAVSVYPQDNASDVGVNSDMAVKFSEPIDRSTVNSKTVRLISFPVGQQAGREENCSLLFAQEDKLLIIRPAKKLDYDTSYAYAITTGLKSVKETHVYRILRTDFRTVKSTPDNTPPAISPPVPDITDIAFGLALNANAEDGQDDPTEMSWKIINPEDMENDLFRAEIDPRTNILEILPKIGAIGERKITLTLFDRGGLSVSQQVTVKVIKPDKTPPEKPRIVKCSWKGGESTKVVPVKPFFMEGRAGPGSTVEILIQVFGEGEKLGGRYYGTADKNGYFKIEIDQVPWGENHFYARAIDSFHNTSELSDAFLVLVDPNYAITRQRARKRQVEQVRRSPHDRPPEFFEESEHVPLASENEEKPESPVRVIRTVSGKPSQNWLVPGLIVVDIVLAGLVILLLLRRKQRTA